ncbi:MAG: hypothetical protein DI556_15285 [Rhodovulum sulfidophilum]|uniref:MmgE/PrpD family protein n=1 Tax=Rhodovulum sulfidophilum TaxID=35806 RepID=A0A2W5Q085_RHOSU|nr:MAG: hypothetical protein DI556_15285 [Rhodovulum sulfidophilum]
MKPITRSLAEFIVGSPASAQPPELRAEANRIIIDTFAAIISGAGGEAAPALLDYARMSGAAGKVPVLGTSLMTSPEIAAMINGAFGHALEFDDVFSMMPGHPAAVILAALIGEIARRPVSGAELTDAFIVGYEVAARMGIAISLEHHRVRGFHATGTLGGMGAAAALARLRRSGVEGAAQTLAIYSSFASGLLGQTGSEMKAFHSGWAARNATAAADLVASGLRGAEDILEAPRGFFNAYGTANSRIERLTENIADPWAMSSPGVSLKKYPCCFAAHRGIEATLILRERHGLRLADVAGIECRLPPKGLVNMVYSRPRTGLQAKFSMEYCFLAAMLDGEITLASFADAAVLREVAQSNLRLVTCHEDPACEEGIGEASGEISGARGYTQIAITTRDGARLEERVAKAPGTPARPLSRAELGAKFEICARYAGLTEAATRAAGIELFACNESKDLSGLLRSLRRA